MTWHCDRWWQNVRDNISDIDSNGETADDLYDQYACNEFSSSISVTVNREDQQIGPPGETDNAYCHEHDHEADWDPGYDLASDLSRILTIGFCEPCDLWFEDTDFFNHQAAEHEDENESEPSPFPSLRHMWTYATP